MEKFVPFWVTFGRAIIDADAFSITRVALKKAYFSKAPRLNPRDVSVKLMSYPVFPLFVMFTTELLMLRFEINPFVLFERNTFLALLWLEL